MALVAALAEGALMAVVLLVAGDAVGRQLGGLHRLLRMTGIAPGLGVGAGQRVSARLGMVEVPVLPIDVVVALLAFRPSLPR